MNLLGWILIAVIATALFGLAMFQIGKAQHERHPARTQNHTADGANETNQKNDSNWAEKNESDASGFLNFAERHNGILLVIVTAILAIATGFLWKATRDLVRGAEDTAKRQLRPYVLPFKGEVSGFIVGQVYEATTRIRNAGQTPALKVLLWRRAGITIPPGENFNAGENIANYYPDFIGPGMERSLSAKAPHTLTQEERDSVIDGSAAVYFFGEIEYRDGFGIKHTTKWRRMFRGKGIDPGSVLQLRQAEEGNDAD